MSSHPLVVEALAAWRRRELESAISGALAAAAADPADDLPLRLAASMAFRAHRVDLLLPVRADVEALAPGIVRESVRAVMLLGAGDLEGAIALVRSVEPEGAGAEDPLADHGSLLPAALAHVALGAVASGAWSAARSCLRAARAALPPIPDEVGTIEHWHNTTLHFDILGMDAVVEAHTGSGGSARAALSAALAPLRARNSLTTAHALALVCLGDVEHVSGQLGEAALNLARGARLAHASRPGIRVHAEVELAFVRIRQGRWDDAVSVVRRTAPPRESMEHDWLEPQALAMHGLLLAIRGDLDSSRPVLDRAALLLRHTPSFLASMVLTHARMLVAITRGDWRDLRRALQDAAEPGYRHPYRRGEWNTLTLLAAWHLRSITEFRRGVGRWGQQADAARDPYYWAFVSILAEHDERTGDSITAVERALELLTLDEDPLGRAWVRVVAGICFGRFGSGGEPDPARALAVYEEASAELRELGATALSARCDEAVAATIAELAHSQGEHPAFRLTEQQRRVADAVGQGYTSGEIAGILHLSKRTVDYHVANIMRRLGASNRREITRILGSGR
ncbi:LuxR C-terminal-related transcriptional regulator [Microbacterium radiodurans]|uniref:HTH luxR-type domain-containing protein n=1 Tax=Microbacterium radiodurans TaxID=661398 RepID=A0A5J5IN67_9MICO|nr:LuxR C-terminal-related transcriptional regulator [Microbacterium radiodurans]KAA9084113.1 hypothetical protein F6B42_14100 [Microbacterium radiodurans]